MRIFRAFILLCFVTMISQAQEIGAGIAWLSSDNLYLQNAKGVNVFGAISLSDHLKLSASYGYFFNSVKDMDYTYKNPWNSHMMYESIGSSATISTIGISIIFNILTEDPFSLSIGLTGNTNILDAERKGDLTGNLIPTKYSHKWGHGLIVATQYDDVFFPSLGLGILLERRFLSGSETYYDIPFGGSISNFVIQFIISYSFSK